MRVPFHQTLPAVLLLAMLALGAADGARRAVAGTGPRVPFSSGLPEDVREGLVSFNGLLHRLAGRRMVSNSKNIDAVRLDNGQLALGPVWRTPKFRRKAARDVARALAGARDALAADGIPLAFVLCPAKVPPGGVGLPRGLEDDDNLLADALVAALRDAGVECLDLRERIAAEEIDHASLFFRTDHHWLPSAGLWAANETAAFLRDRHGFPADLARTAPENYETRRVSDRYLGSFGRRTGPWYAGTEPFDIVVPRFPTDFVFDAPRVRHHTEGPFPEAFLHGIDRPRGLYRESLYDDYLASQQPFSRIVNRGGGNGRTLCVVKDSFASVMLPNLAVHYRGIVLLDPRNDPRISLFRTVREEGADAVLFVLNPNSIVRRHGFFGSPFLRPEPRQRADGEGWRPMPATGATRRRGSAGAGR
jgi:hypothetical protein